MGPKLTVINVANNYTRADEKKEKGGRRGNEAQVLEIPRRLSRGSLFAKADKGPGMQRTTSGGGPGRISRSAEKRSGEIIYSAARQDKWISSATVN